jgi:hypothetical protein
VDAALRAILAMIFDGPCSFADDGDSMLAAGAIDFT